jgi:hypothetical protein
LHRSWCQMPGRQAIRLPALKKATTKGKVFFRILRVPPNRLRGLREGMI